MRKTLASLLAVLALPALAAASDVEIAGFAGYTFPFYEQTFSYGPGPITVPIPGVSIEQSGAFRLTGSGGPVFGGSLALFPIDAVGLEVRLDSAEVNVKSDASTFDVHVTLPSPLPPVNSSLSLPASEAQMDAAKPFSVNLKFRSEGNTRVFVSGGVSHLADLNFSIQQSVALGVSTVNLETSNLEIATLTLRARRKPGDPKKNWGANAGIGFQLPLGENGGLFVEGRGFYFPAQKLEWEAVIDTPLGEIESQLLDRMLQQLDAVEIKPWWVQATVGVSYRF